ncbi:MAG: hypothetical protein COU69_03930 [Candidatus Pacebacteria bacterium CG10_big_fil_rev_8_21_14_0_10_56_10]|nr:MAG: hypothetical protein COU69_03930 [Candidatus Pacebacteria bacterium CG10_big_fil_rev_8_21_14_0_10_56_10]
MTFADFSRQLAELDKVAARLEKTKLLAETFRLLDEDEIPPACYLMLGSLVPEYQSLEFQLSTKMVLRALAELKLVGADRDADENDRQRELERLTEEYKRLGDIGALAEKVVQRIAQNPAKKTTKNSAKKTAQKPAQKTDASADSVPLLDVYRQLKKIAEESGPGSQQSKRAGLARLLRRLDAVSAKYVTRMVIGRLRLGFSTMTMLDGLSWAVNGDKTDSKQLEQAYQRRADIGRLAQEYLADGPSSDRQQTLDDIQVEVGIPVVPALCQRLDTAAEILEKLGGTVIAEPKYDGLRVQLHIDKKAQPPIQVFTRSLDNVTRMFPEARQVIEQVKCQTCILDGEAISYHPQTGVLRPFQDTMQRKRKHGIADKADELPVRFYFFDVLAVNGRSLINQPLTERQQQLQELLPPSTSRQATNHQTTSPQTANHQTTVAMTAAETFTDAGRLRAFHTEQLAAGLEGAVIKRPAGSYSSGRKGWNWVKIKEAEGTTGKLRDTIDAVVLGYYFGRGKRTEFGVGAFLAGVPVASGERRGMIVTIAKIGTGLSDEQLRQLKTKADRLQTNQADSRYQVPKELAPDVWTEPRLVTEIAADEITHSPLHTAGVALRFPRLIKFRADKNADQATTLEEVKQLSDL